MKHRLEKVPLYIKEVMDSKGITNRELVEKLGITPEAVSNIKCNRAMPSLSSLLKIAEALGVTIDTLVYGFQDENRHKKEAEKRYIAIGSYFPNHLELIIEIREKDTNRVVAMGKSWSEIAVACFERGITKEQIEIKSI